MNQNVPIWPWRWHLWEENLRMLRLDHNALVKCGYWDAWVFQNGWISERKTAKVNMSDLGLEIDARRSAGANITLQPHLKYSCYKVAICKSIYFSLLLMCVWNPNSLIVEVSIKLSITSYRSPSFLLPHLHHSQIQVANPMSPTPNLKLKKIKLLQGIQVSCWQIWKGQTSWGWKYSNRASANISIGLCYQLVWPVLPPWQLSNSLMWELYEIKLDEHHSKKLLIYSWHFAIVGNRNICWCAKEAPRKSIFRCDSIS